MAIDGFINAYLAVGADTLKRQRVIERLRSRLEKFGDISFNNDVFQGDNADGAEIVAACNTLPFASEVRLVEVSDADKLSKTSTEALISYLSAPCESTILMLSAEKLAKSTRLYKAVANLGKNAIIDCTPMKKQELASSLRSMAVSHGFTMTPGACEKMLELVGEDTVRIDTELKKLALAHNGNDPVTDSEVASLVARTSEAKPWDLVDAFAARNLARCFHLLPQLSQSSPFFLLAQSQTRLRELLCTKALERQGRARDLATVLGVPPWKVKNHVRWARAFSEQQLVEALILSRDAEMKMKSGTDQVKVFQNWMCASIARRIH